MYLPGRAGAPGGLWRWEPGDRAPVRVLDDVAAGQRDRLEPGGGPDVLRRLAAPGGQRLPVRRRARRPRRRPSRSSRCRPRPGSPTGSPSRPTGRSGWPWPAVAPCTATPRTGSLSERVELPVRFPTSCAFGGAGADRPVRHQRLASGAARAAGRAVAAGAGALFRVATDCVGLHHRTGWSCR